MTKNNQDRFNTFSNSSCRSRRDSHMIPVLQTQKLDRFGQASQVVAKESALPPKAVRCRESCYGVSAQKLYVMLWSRVSIQPESCVTCVSALALDLFFAQQALQFCVLSTSFSTLDLLQESRAAAEEARSCNCCQAEVAQRWSKVVSTKQQVYVVRKRSLRVLLCFGLEAR